MVDSSWLDIHEESPFSIDNIPFGIIAKRSVGLPPSPAIAIGSYCISLKILAQGGAFAELPDLENDLDVLIKEATLNAFAALGRTVHRAARIYIRELLMSDTQYPDLLKNNHDLRLAAIHNIADCEVRLPMHIGDYTDFYAGLNHAYNVGVLFRGPQNALQPNYMHLPVGYHGRASTIRTSGYPIRRAHGQIILPESTSPVLTQCRKLDFELELAAFLCKGNGPAAEPIKIDEADDYIFGYVLMNDWSARDIQAFEYVPLGPFGSKNFATTISPWVVLTDALEPFRCDSSFSTANGFPVQNRTVLPYLKEKSRKGTQLNIELRVDLRPANSATSTERSQPTWHRLSSTNAANLLYSFPQMLTHHTITGCEMKVGDLLGSGTISGSSRESMGSLLEMTDNGKIELKLQSNDEVVVGRKFLQDGDEVRMTAYAGERGRYVGFGDCSGVIVPAYNVDD